MSIESATITRWNARDLDTTIARLYPGEESQPAEGNLPRANYGPIDESERERSRGNRIYDHTIPIIVRSDNFNTIGTWIDLIRDEFQNSKDAAANAFSIAASEGVIVSVDVIDRTRGQEADRLFFGIITLAVVWQKAETVPS